MGVIRTWWDRLRGTRRPGDAARSEGGLRAEPPVPVEAPGQSRPAGESIAPATSFDQLLRRAADAAAADRRTPSGDEPPSA